jgi:hypothetical protein
MENLHHEPSPLSSPSLIVSSSRGITALSNKTNYLSFIFPSLITLPSKCLYFWGMQMLLNPTLLCRLFYSYLYHNEHRPTRTTLLRQDV